MFSPTHSCHGEKKVHGDKTTIVITIVQVLAYLKENKIIRGIESAFYYVFKLILISNILGLSTVPHRAPYKTLPLI